MKQIIIVLVLLCCLQTAAFSQTNRTSRTSSKTHHRSKHYRHHKTTYYYTHDEKANADGTQPSPYKGDNTPSNDGHKKNEKRNLNANTGTPLPPSSGNNR